MKNHLLVYGVDKELAHLAADPQTLIDEIQNLGGMSFLAHPVDQSAPLVGEGDLSWVDWPLEGFTGLELWNFGAQYKALLTSWPRIIYYTLFPTRICSFPFADSFRIWDGLLKQGKRISVIGGADAHGNSYNLGPIRRTIFPYKFLFKNINTHILLEESLSYDAEKDRAALYHALGNGRCFVANDGVAPANGFRFTAEADDGEHQMGSTIERGFGMTLKIRLPAPASIRLIKDGDVLKDWQNVDAAILPVSIPGSYRVEAIVGHGNRARGWIYSNPIYLSI